MIFDPNLDPTQKTRPKTKRRSKPKKPGPTHPMEKHGSTLGKGQVQAVPNDPNLTLTKTEPDLTRPLNMSSQDIITTSSLGGLDCKKVAKCQTVDYMRLARA